jgi:hypothetical protein
MGYTGGISPKSGGRPNNNNNNNNNNIQISFPPLSKNYEVIRN